MDKSIAALSSTQPLSSGLSPSSFSAGPSKPALPERLIKIRGSFSKAGEEAAHCALNRLEKAQTEIQFWTKEELNQQLSQSWTDQAWSFFSAVSTLCASLVSFGLGFYVFGTSETATVAAAGKAMIAAGVLDIVREICTQMGMWDKIADSLLEESEQHIKDQLKRQLPLILSLLNAACSLFAAQRLGSYKDLMGIVQTGLSLVNAGGQGYFSLQKAHGEVKTSEIRAESEHHRQKAEILSRLATVLMEEMKRIKDTLKKTAVSMMDTASFAAQKI